jgi:hypothetical protein
VAYVSAAPVSADNIGVNKATALGGSFVISGTHSASISGTYTQIGYKCAGLPVYQEGGSDGLVFYQQDGCRHWHVVVFYCLGRSRAPGAAQDGPVSSEPGAGRAVGHLGCASQVRPKPDRFSQQRRVVQAVPSRASNRSAI